LTVCYLRSLAFCIFQSSRHWQRSIGRNGGIINTTYHWGIRLLVICIRFHWDITILAFHIQWRYHGSSILTFNICQYRPPSWPLICLNSIF
jgi:hypothetical protein